MTDTGFPFQVRTEDLKEPTLSRLNRMLAYLWSAVQALVGNGVATDFLNGKGQYVDPVATPVSANFPAHFNSNGAPGAIAVDLAGNIFVCYSVNLWVRVGPAGTSTAF